MFELQALKRYELRWLDPELSGTVLPESIMADMAHMLTHLYP